MHKEDFLKIENADTNVPWDRKGFPGTKKEGSIDIWSGLVVNIAEEGNRLKTSEWCLELSLKENSHLYVHNFIEERMFAELWDYENNSICSNLLWTLMQYHPKMQSLIKDHNDVILVEKVAAMMMQWLGTNVGSGFIDSARKATKTEIESIEDSVIKQKEKVASDKRFVEAKELKKKEEKKRSKKRAMSRYFKNQAKKKGIKRKKI